MGGSKGTPFSLWLLFAESPWLSGQACLSCTREAQPRANAREAVTGKAKPYCNEKPKAQCKSNRICSLTVANAILDSHIVAFSFADRISGRPTLA